MEKKNFIRELNDLKTSQNKNVSLFVNLLLDICVLFSNDIEYQLEYSKNNLSIRMIRSGNDLDIDLNNNFLDIRLNYSEINFFIDEIEKSVLMKIIVDFFKGNYYINYYSDSDNRLISLELIWNDTSLASFNKPDIYAKGKYQNMVVKEGINWLD